MKESEYSEWCVCVATVRSNSTQCEWTVASWMAVLATAAPAVSDADYGALKMLANIVAALSCDGQRAIGLRPNNKKRSKKMTMR